MSDIIEPKHYDFLAAALVPTNEQRMVAALERIVELLTPAKTSGGPGGAPSSEALAKAPAAVAKKPFGRK